MTTREGSWYSQAAPGNPSAERRPVSRVSRRARYERRGGPAPGRGGPGRPLDGAASVDCGIRATGSPGCASCSSSRARGSQRSRPPGLPAPGAARARVSRRRGSPGTTSGCSICACVDSRMRASGAPCAASARSRWVHRLHPRGLRDPPPRPPHPPRAPRRASGRRRASCDGGAVRFRRPGRRCRGARRRLCTVSRPGRPVGLRRGARRHPPRAHPAHRPGARSSRAIPTRRRCPHRARPMAGARLSSVWLAESGRPGSLSSRRWRPSAPRTVVACSALLRGAFLSEGAICPGRSSRSPTRSRPSRRSTSTSSTTRTSWTRSTLSPWPTR